MGTSCNVLIYVSFADSTNIDDNDDDDDDDDDNDDDDNDYDDDDDDNDYVSERAPSSI